MSQFYKIHLAFSRGCFEAIFMKNTLGCLGVNNVLFHRHGNFLYIGICDWGMASSNHCPIPSYYGYDSFEELQNEIHQRPHLDLKLFYLKSRNQRPQHNTLIESYAVGKIAMKIVGEYLVDK
jgi:hypothetical protein